MMRKNKRRAKYELWTSELALQNDFKNYRQMTIWDYLQLHRMVKRIS